MKEGSLVEWTGVFPRNPVGPFKLKKGEIYVVTHIVSPEELRRAYPKFRFDKSYIEVDAHPNTYISEHLFKELQPPGEVNIEELLKAPVTLEPA